MTNTNCLDGLRCPKCPTDGPLRIHGNAEFIMHDNGHDAVQNITWEDSNFCACDLCGFEGVVSDFRLSECVTEGHDWSNLTGRCHRCGLDGLA